MTRNNVLSLLTAGVMGISCFSMNVSAESAYAVGDVDMDGIVTGHDTAMVSRYLLDEDYTLTEEQLSLADVDADGEVTQADADKLYNEMQEYALGNVYWQDGYSYVNITDCTEILIYYACTTANIDYDFTMVQKNLADLDLDGDADTTDAKLTMGIYGMYGCHLGDLNAKGGIYYYSADSESVAYMRSW